MQILTLQRRRENEIHAQRVSKGVTIREKQKKDECKELLEVGVEEGELRSKADVGY